MELGPLRRALAAELAARTDRTAFELVQDPTWVAANVDHYVTRVTLTRTRMLSYDADPEDHVRFGQWIWEQAHGDGNTCADPDGLYLDLAPYFECIVEFARPEFADHLSSGRVFGTVAYAAHPEPPWSSPALVNAPDWVCEEFIAGPGGEPMAPPAREPKRRSGRGAKGR